MHPERLECAPLGLRLRLELHLVRAIRSTLLRGELRGELGARAGHRTHGHLLLHSLALGLLLLSRLHAHPLHCGSFLGGVAALANLRKPRERRALGCDGARVGLGAR